LETLWEPERAAAAIDESPARAILFGHIRGVPAKRKNEAHQIKRFLRRFGFETLPLSKKVGLLMGNTKHFKCFKDLHLKKFRA
jgi:hypothetical protein